MTNTARLLRSTLAATASLTLFVGCAQPPTTSASRANTPAGQSASQGAIAPAALAGITDSSKQATAAIVSTNVAAALRANAAMRDAALLQNTPPAAYSVLERGEGDHGDRPAAVNATANGQASGKGQGDQAPARASEGKHRDHDDTMKATGSASATVGDGQHGQHEGDDEKGQAEKHARDERGKLSEQAKSMLEKLVRDHLDGLKGKLARKLQAKAKRFAHQGSDQVGARADGGKDVTSTFTIAKPDGTRTVTTTRSVDATGNLIETSQKLSGTNAGTTYDGTRTSVVNADGSTTVVSDVKVTVNGKTSEVKLTSQVAADGTETASGTITTPDGKSVPLEAKGVEGGKQTVKATDAASGVAVKVDDDEATGTATATADAGAAGTASVQLKTDDDDQGEGDRGDGEHGNGNHGDGNHGDGEHGQPTATASGTVTAKP